LRACRWQALYIFNNLENYYLNLKLYAIRKAIGT
jgi:hypothetical protein